MLIFSIVYMVVLVVSIIFVYTKKEKKEIISMIP